MRDVLPVLLAHAMPSLPAFELLRSACPELPEPVLIHATDDPAARDYARLGLETFVVDAAKEADAYSLPLRRMPAKSLTPQLSALSRISTGLSSGHILALSGDVSGVVWRVNARAADYSVRAYSLGAVLDAACQAVDALGVPLIFRATSGGVCACLFPAALSPLFVPDPLSCLEKSFRFSLSSHHPWAEFPLPLCFVSDAPAPASPVSRPLFVSEDADGKAAL